MKRRCQPQDEPVAKRLFIPLDPRLSSSKLKITIQQPKQVVAGLEKFEEWFQCMMIQNRLVFFILEHIILSVDYRCMDLDHPVFSYRGFDGTIQIDVKAQRMLNTVITHIITNSRSDIERPILKKLLIENSPEREELLRLFVTSFAAKFKLGTSRRPANIFDSKTR